MGFRKNNLKVSVCVTIFNEKEETIRELLGALNKQTLKPNEIIFVDASASPIFNSQFLISNELTRSTSLPNINFQFMHRARVSRAEGRNIAIKKAKNEIIAITDAGCVPHKEWLGELVKGFEIATASPRNDTKIASSQTPRNDTVVAGSYKMIARNSFEKAEAVFLGVKEQDIKSDFLPSARSMAITKAIWKKAGGFPENLNDTAEDTVFNIKLLNAGAKFVVAKKAIVDWKMPETIKEFGLKIYGYAKGDAESGIWWHPVKKWRTHNIKVLTVFLRYLLAFALLAFGFYRILWGFIGIYLLFAFKKAGLWGIPLQFVSDFAIMSGFTAVLIKNLRLGRFFCIFRRRPVSIWWNMFFIGVF